jgi:hypothetical protein
VEVEEGEVISMETKIFKDGVEVGTEISTEQQSSIKITQNAKGEKAFEVKVYADDPERMIAQLDCYLEIAKARIGV